MSYGSIGKEAIIEVGTLEAEMHEAVKEVPDEDYAEFGGGRGMQQPQRKDVSDD